MDSVPTGQSMADALSELTDGRVLDAVIRVANAQPGHDRSWALVSAVVAALCEDLTSDAETDQPALRTAIREKLRQIVRAHEELSYAQGG